MERAELTTKVKNIAAMPKCPIVARINAIVKGINAVAMPKCPLVTGINAIVKGEKPIARGINTIVKGKKPIVTRINTIATNNELCMVTVDIQVKDANSLEEFITLWEDHFLDTVVITK